EGDIQGQLYSRLLEHIRDDETRLIAHPGLIVRRLTPEVIAEVLAEPCGLGKITLARAERIFDEFRREATLCESSGDGDSALLHRQDVRAVMLPSILRARPETARKIHRRAIRYYAGRSSKIDRREELYHRLMLGQQPRTLDQRWEDRAGAELATLVDEFPATSQLYLAGKVNGLRLDASVVAAATDEQWIRLTSPIVKRQIERGRYSDALSQLRERQDLSGASLIPNFEIEALDRLGRLEEALGLARRQRAGAENKADMAQVRTLLLHEARILERLRRWEEARGLLRNLHEIGRSRRRRAAAEDGEKLDDLLVLASLLRVNRHLGADGELNALVD
nr:hypothetical protein [Micromonospora sp. DSM 115978]